MSLVSLGQRGALVGAHSAKTGAYDPEQTKVDQALINALKAWHVVTHGGQVRGIEAILSDDLVDLFDAQDIAAEAWANAQVAKEEDGPDSEEYEAAIEQWIEATRMVCARMPRAGAEGEGGAGEGASASPSPAVDMFPANQAARRGGIGQIAVVSPVAPAQSTAIQPQSVVVVPQQAPAQSAQPTAAPAPQVIYVPQQQAPRQAPRRQQQGPVIIQTPKRKKKKKAQQRIVLLRKPTR